MMEVWNYCNPMIRNGLTHDLQEASIKANTLLPLHLCPESLSTLIHYLHKVQPLLVLIYPHEKSLSQHQIVIIPQRVPHGNEPGRTVFLPLPPTIAVKRNLVSPPCKMSNKTVLDQKHYLELILLPTHLNYRPPIHHSLFPCQVRQNQRLQGRNTLV